ncbi:EH signature domain-containing protein [Sphingomonas colocasiae]|uniref:Zorya protein ZorC EH domain-containing protein n=1 Tax=Sphingomonas colocasiae TaxID=1848973 RepID=A0ABS7PQV2_9SPHN|nr:EH signature domain-containing protein [Sphingomonas colocasiae]MBY8823354.1 hypothetical protein [Sphingomonas colocasiae]
MTTLAALLADPTTLLRRVTVRAPEPAALRREAAAITGDARTVTDPERIAVLQARVAALVLEGGIARISRRDLRESCRTFLNAPNPPARASQIGGALIQRVRETGRRPAFFALLDAYLDGFAIDDEDVRRLAQTLAQIATTWSWRPTDAWRDRIAEFDLLNPQGAPDRIAARILESTDGGRSVLQASGLDVGGRRKGGLVEAAFVSACRAVSTRKVADIEDAQSLLLVWGQEQGTLTFPRAWPDLVRACLLPWATREPTDAHKVMLVEGLERLGGGDPRIPGRGRWSVIASEAPDAHAILMRWLTKASVMQFLEIVDRSLRDGDARRMWSYRRAFWTSYLLSESGARIDQAWVAFGSEGARLARAVAHETGDRSLSVFGEQSEKSSQHAALLVRIGDLLIVDWSHSAKYNVWRRGEGGPALFRQTYLPGALDSAPLRESHHAPANYTWQKRLAFIIEGKRYSTEKPSWRPRRV